jgi:hypothetical protein
MCQGSAEAPLSGPWLRLPKGFWKESQLGPYATRKSVETSSLDAAVPVEAWLPVKEA